MKKHTTGPWDVYRLADDPQEYGTLAGKYIITANDHEDEVSGVIHREADARLIAAAPELLDSAQYFAYAAECDADTTLDNLDDDEVVEVHVTGKALKDLRAAIAKAEGR